MSASGGQGRLIISPRFIDTIRECACYQVRTSLLDGEQVRATRRHVPPSSLHAVHASARQGSLTLSPTYQCPHQIRQLSGRPPRCWTLNCRARRAAACRCWPCARCPPQRPRRLRQQAGRRPPHAPPPLPPAPPARPRLGPATPDRKAGAEASGCCYVRHTERAGSCIPSLAERVSVPSLFLP